MLQKDVFDILLVAAVFYVLLAWLRLSLPRGVARRSMIAAPIAVVVYLLARVMDLHLLEQVLEGLLVAILVGAVVVYQSDIRRMLDRAFTGRAPDRPKFQLVDTLTEAAAYMSAAKMGALIAIRGREPWATHISGGIELRGAVSAPLLYSIFHPGTPGHDGAVLIEGNHLTRFAAHLPLASDLPDVSRYGGTRHAAAVGLSQECDALVIVVSEERGAISIAENGTLTDPVTPTELGRRLRQFLRRPDHPEAIDARASWWSSARMRTALVSLALATTLWTIFVYSPDTVLRTFRVPVAVRNLPENWVVAEGLPVEASLELSGSERSFRELNAASLVVAVDLSQPSKGVREIVLGEDNITLPSGITLRRARPTSIALELQPTRMVRVPVVIPTTGVLPSRLELVSVDSVPRTLQLVVPEGTDEPDYIETEALDLGQIVGDIELKRPVMVPPQAHLPPDATSDVVVRVDVRPKFATGG